MRASHLSSIICLFLVICPEVCSAETSCSEMKAQIIADRNLAAQARSAATSIRISGNVRRSIYDQPTNEDNEARRLDEQANELDNNANQEQAEFVRNCPKGWQAY